MRVLIADDDEVLARAVAAGLRREGMAVDVALDGGAALEHVEVNRYDTDPSAARQRRARVQARDVKLAAGAGLDYLTQLPIRQPLESG